MFHRYGRSLRGVAVLLCAAIPVVAALAAPPLSIYGNLPGFEMAAISSSGQYVAVVGAVGEDRQLIVVDRESKPILVAPLGDVKARDLHWIGDEKLLLRSSNTVDLGANFTRPKAELYNVVVIAIPTGKAAYPVFRGNANVTGGVRGYYGGSRRDGRSYGYFGGYAVTKIPARGSLRPDLFEVDLETGKARVLAGRNPNDVQRDWLIDGQGKVAASLDFQPHDGDWSIRNRQGDVIAQGRAPQGGIDLLSLGRSPGTVVYAESDEETGQQRWLEMPLAGGVAVEIAAGENVVSPLVDPVTRQLIGHSRGGDLPQLSFYDVGRQKIVARVERAFPGRQVVIQDWSDAFDRLIVRTEGSGDPQSWFLVDVKTNAAKQIGMAYPLLEKDVGAVRTVRYKAADGLEMSGVLTLPADRPARKLPVVMLPHGGPSTRDYAKFDWWAQALASRGYAVFQPNFRGSSGFGASFRMAGRGEWGRKMQTDISDGLAELVSQGIVDPRRACIMGASYGGYAALAGVTLQKGLYRCAVSVAGLSDLSKHYQQSMMQSLQDRTLMRWLKAEIGSGKDLKMISPARFAETVDAPVLLIHGKDDTVVPFEQSSAMADALKDAKKPVELITLKGEDHWLSRSATRQAMLTAALAFVEKNNPPDPAP